MFGEIRIPFTQIRIGRFLFLLISMVLLIILRPFLQGYIRLSYLMGIFLTLIYLSAVYAASQKKSTLIIALVMALLIEILELSRYLTGLSGLGTTGNLLAIVFLAYTSTIILVYLFREDEITVDIIVGAICVYFLMGLLWSFVFATLESFQPGSFRVLGEVASDISHFSYYSFVTLTTLGYGDITPLSPPAKSFAILEAMTGQLYIAVLIARLVGIHIAQTKNEQEKG